MSNKFQGKNKNLSCLQVVTADKVWEKNGKDSKGKPKFRLKKELNIFGKVEKETTAYVSKHNSNGKNNKYVEDFCNLNKNTKNEIVDMLHNKNKKVVYLIKK